MSEKGIGVVIGLHWLMGGMSGSSAAVHCIGEIYEVAGDSVCTLYYSEKENMDQG